jgi:glycosyltransferase involved in cell wall biosynthesis
MTDIDGIKTISQLGRRFSHSASQHHTRRMRDAEAESGLFAPPLKPLFIGIATSRTSEGRVAIGFATRDNTYMTDYCVSEVDLGKNGNDVIADHVLATAQAYEKEHYCKFIGAGLTIDTMEIGPTLCSRLWLETDIIPLVFPVSAEPHDGNEHVDEAADSMARKCIMNFGPSLTPILHVGWRGLVDIDAASLAHMNQPADHQKTCSAATWKALSLYADHLKDKQIRIAFFSSTPQGGGVALMRHALVRLSRLLGVDLKWYVPKPRPGVFRSTKNMHNILQGVAEPEERLSLQEQECITEWITQNAERYWLTKGGPLMPPEEGGAHIVMIDDPQMPGLIPLIKKVTPNRPVLYRSHIQLRSDLIAQDGTPQAEVWDYLWKNIQLADLFISHPIPEFVPHNVPREKVVYMPATTDWLDGLNKPIRSLDVGYYGSNYNMQCRAQRMTPLEYPRRKYIVQIARFDPSKGIPTVIDSYAEFRRLASEADMDDVPQLVIAGNGSIDDPDANMIFDTILDRIEEKCPDLMGDISVMRLEANDQLLNMLLSHAHVALQLSTREGFEVKVSEALHAGRPVIATRAGGIPLQVKDKVNGFLIEPGDHKAVAKHLLELFDDDDLWKRMSHAASTGVSDEVGTPGNALAWYYLASKMGADGQRFEGHGRWINDLAREEAGCPYEKGENQIPRGGVHNGLQG